MAHELEIKNGQAQMFSVREVPWHKLGTIISEAPSITDGINLAGLNWEVLERPIAYDNGATLKSGIDYVKIDGYKSLIRSDDQSVLSIMKNSYTPLQNQVAFDFFEPFLQAKAASLETAGSLKEGRVVWVMARLNKAPIEVGKGDEVNKFLLLSNSHDGTLAVRVGFTPIRVVCSNTLTSSHSSSASQIIKIRHSKSVNNRLDNIQEIINAVDAQFEATAEQYKFLASKVINKEDFENFVKIIFKLKDDPNDRDKLRKDRMMLTITKLFENGAGSHLKSAKGTRWGAYNAVTEYLTHEYGTSEETRLYANWYGYAANVNSSAFSTLVKGAF